ncbi:MAG TPA: hypothetical protein VF170_00230 [Planctomycetaceae bacterium]
MVFGTALAAAAALSVDGGVIQAGADNTLVCDDDGIYVSAWATNTYPVDEGVESVKIKGVNPACDGARILGRVELTSSDPADNSTYLYTSGTNPYASGYTDVIANGDRNTEYTLYLKQADYTTPVWEPAENIVGIKIWLEGTSS